MSAQRDELLALHGFTVSRQMGEFGEPFWMCDLYVANNRYALWVEGADEEWAREELARAAWLSLVDMAVATSHLLELVEATRHGELMHVQDPIGGDRGVMIGRFPSSAHVRVS